MTEITYLPSYLHNTTMQELILSDQKFKIFLKI